MDWCDFRKLARKDKGCQLNDADENIAVLNYLHLKEYFIGEPIHKSRTKFIYRCVTKIIKAAGTFPDKSSFLGLR